MAIICLTTSSISPVFKFILFEEEPDDFTSFTSVLADCCCATFGGVNVGGTVYKGLFASGFLSAFAGWATCC